jgi:hypothetical protein
MTVHEHWQGAALVALLVVLWLVAMYAIARVKATHSKEEGS